MHNASGNYLEQFQHHFRPELSWMKGVPFDVPHLSSQILKRENMARRMSARALISLVLVGVAAPVMCWCLPEFSEQKNFILDPSVEGSPPSPVVLSPPSSVSYSDSPYHASPATPYSPETPSISTPSPVAPDPGHSSGTCSYWTNHPHTIWAIFGFRTVSQCFGIPCVTIFGWDPTLHGALTNSRADGVGALFREGTAAYLNSVVDKSFPWTTQQVKNAFVSAIASDDAAAAQAQIFRKANEGKLKI